MTNIFITVDMEKSELLNLLGPDLSPTKARFRTILVNEFKARPNGYPTRVEVAWVIGTQ